MNPLDPQGTQALYLQLADELRSAIRRGEIQPGERLPAERDLAERYDASRTTVRLALGMLKAEGLIASGPGRGTFVRQRPPVQLAFSRFSRRKREPGMGPWEIATREAGINGETRMIAVEQQTADAELAYRLGIDEGAGVVLRSRHMLADGHVIQLYDAWYPLELVDGTELAGPAKIVDGIYAALERIGQRPASASEEIRARAATPEESTLLRLGTGIPVLTVTRTTRGDAGRVLEVLEVVANAEANTFIYEDLPLA